MNGLLIFVDLSYVHAKSLREIEPKISLHSQVFGHISANIWSQIKNESVVETLFYAEPVPLLAQW
jgi:hypothetical protein